VDTPDAGVQPDAGLHVGPFKPGGTLKTAPTTQPSNKTKDPNDYLKDR
jgi:hypothetical protein